MSGFNVDMASTISAMKVAEVQAQKSSAIAAKSLDLMVDQGVALNTLIDSTRVSKNVATFSGVGQLVDVKA